MPTAANAGYYAQIVAERAVLRRLVEAGTKIVQLGYAQGGGDVEDIVNAAQAEVYAVVDKRGGDDYHRLGDILEMTVDEIEVASGKSGEMTGVPTGFTDLDSLTNGLHPGQMIVLAARPAIGKSTLGSDIVRSASIRHNLASVIFSLEMSKTEITMRLLSAEAGIQLQHMRKGTMREEDWTRLASTMGRVSEAPLFIDDSPNMSLMEIRAKCRRLKQRDNLKLVVIDYLQLMSSGKRVESRQQEVSEFSRALKLLAKELEVPVVAISQLNRGPEQRTDKKPQMSDLRESGCLTAETRVLRADTGAEMSMGELLATGETDVPVWSLDDSLRYVRRHLTHVFPTGTRPVFRLTPRRRGNRSGRRRTTPSSRMRDGAHWATCGPATGWPCPVTCPPRRPSIRGSRRGSHPPRAHAGRRLDAWPGSRSDTRVSTRRTSRWCRRPPCRSGSSPCVTTTRRPVARRCGCGPRSSSATVSATRSPQWLDGGRRLRVAQPREVRARTASSTCRSARSRCSFGTSGRPTVR